jgi:hypothetical protein
MNEARGNEARADPGTAQMPLVSIRDLSKYYIRGDQVIPVLVGIDLDVNAGDYIALMGPSGSGKSTLLNLIAGIDKPSAGEIRVAGVDIAQLSDADLALWRASHVGFIFQFYNLMPVLTAYGNVELPLQLTSLSRRERRERVDTALALVGGAVGWGSAKRGLYGGGGGGVGGGGAPHPGGWAFSGGGLAPRPGERILDLACGDGALTASIAASGAEVVGVVAIEEQVAGARARGLDARELMRDRVGMRVDFGV